MTRKSTGGGKPPRPAPAKRKSNPPHRHEREQDEDRPVWLYGRHAVAAALQNPARVIHRVVGTTNAVAWLAENGVTRPVEDMKPAGIDGMLPPGAVHQGLAAYADELPRARLKEACAPIPGEMRPVVVLDQITDVQNIGAIFRTAAAFDARAIIVQERRMPALSGALAKAAAGAVETVPCVSAVNIARALEALKDLGYRCAGLAGEAEATIGELPRDRPVALVMGAEGAGLRPLVAETCESLVRIPIAARMESLNVSNAAAIALYELSR